MDSSTRWTFNTLALAELRVVRKHTDFLSGNHIRLTIREADKSKHLCLCVPLCVFVRTCVCMCAYTSSAALFFKRKGIISHTFLFLADSCAWLFLPGSDSFYRVQTVMAVSQLLLPAIVRRPIGSLLCQCHPELRHRGLSLLQHPPLMGPLSPSLPPSIALFPLHPIHLSLQSRATHPKLC